MNFDWSDLQVFLAVCEAGSFSGAARRLKVSQPTLSRKIAEMEYELGEPLFSRRNQGITPTAAGRRLLPAAQGMAQWASEASRSLDEKNSPVSGRVRITAPPGVAFDFLAPFAQSLRKKQPHLTLEVLAKIELLNLARGEADIALRTNPSDDPVSAPDLVVIDQVQMPIAAYASKEYVKTLPKRVDWRDVDWIAWAGAYESLSPNPELAAKIPGFRPAFTSDDYIVQLTACHAGVGAMVLPKGPHRFSKQHELVELKLKFPQTTRGTLAIVCHKRMVDLPKVRIVTELLREEFAYLKKRL